MQRYFFSLFLFFSILSGSLTESARAQISTSDRRSDIREYRIQKILLTQIESAITPAIQNYLQAAYTHATEANFDAVQIRINTPGGLVSSTRDILSLIGSSSIPTIVWIGPEGASATSAGAIIAAAAHILLIADGGHIGAATPILPGGEDIKEGDSRSKAINDLTALVQSLAQLRGRNTDLYKSMITEASSYTAQEAVQEHIVDGLANSPRELLTAIHGRSLLLKDEQVRISLPDPPELHSFDMDLGQKLLNILSDPNLAYILFLLGSALLYLEMQMPGTFLSGALGVLCLTLAGIGFHVLPVNFGAMGLIILAFILMILEVFVSSFGLLTISAIGSLLTGSLFLFRTDEAYIEVSRTLVIAVALSVSLFMAGLGLFWLRDRRSRTSRDDYYSLKGAEGHIIKVLSGSAGGLYHYQIRVRGEVWNACSENEYQSGDLCTISGQKEHELMLII